MRPVAVVGNLTLDRRGAGPLRPGGGPFHAARALRLLERPAILVVRCSEGDRPALLPPLVSLGLPVHWRPAARTAIFGIDYAGEERRLEVESLGSPWSLEDAAWASRLLSGSDWVHVAPLSRSDFGPAALAALARGRRLSLDGQGLVRVPREGPLELDADFDRSLLESVSILKLSEEEALVAAGGLEERALLALGVPEVVVTLGSRGAIVLADGLAERIPARALPATSIDPTGAGDAFAASYLVARAGGSGPPGAARWASGVVQGLLGGRLR
ncbi:MAG: carbohydrate kinase [Actinobacteria bacterium]|nr:carbohydrate kinase [Actinomycetota bacterium]